jgi:hypothetical protein
MDIDFSGWKWPNSWRLTFLLIALAAFFDIFANMHETAKVFGFIGGVLFVIHAVLRPEDVQKFLDSSKK